MPFIADLHVHSRFSRATAKNLDLEHLYISAAVKGISVVATGDFTHPAWFQELREKLIPAEPGLFALREDIRRRCDAEIPPSCKGTVRFILETEISNIYKKADRTRKNHNLIYVPSLAVAETLNARLDAIGNIRSDGRPILGLDARNILEVMLECSEDAFLIPAHIWTPWFSLLGSRSGFDSLSACFEDLSHHIFAVETGLSSDPPMNRRISELDSRTLVSNSDAHSPANLGRNANLFDTTLSFFGIRDALLSGDPDRCRGTIDLYPEEGKYHMDGHRKCGIWRRPSEGAETEWRCPACGAPMTLGVLHRVETLADRPEGAIPDGKPPFYHLIPLAEILSEILDVGVKTRTVDRCYRKAIHCLGPELHILKDCPIDRILEADIPLLGEAIDRMRSGRVHISPGFDGEYGRIRVFAQGEKSVLTGQQSLFSRKRTPAAAVEASSPVPPFGTALPERGDAKALPATGPNPSHAASGTDSLNTAQKSAVVHSGSPLLIIAGPGTGKTRTLTHRIVFLTAVRRVSPENILAITFTNKAAREMRERVAALFQTAGPSLGRLPTIGTFHGFCLTVLRSVQGDSHTVIDEHDRQRLIQAAFEKHGGKTFSPDLSARRLSDLITRAKQYLWGPEDDLSSLADEKACHVLGTIYRSYQGMLTVERLLDYDDLIMNTVRHLEGNPAFRRELIDRYHHVLVDEYQDVNPAQYRLVRILCPRSDKELFVIGDPDQSIYGFRGADAACFSRFAEDYPGSRTIHLNRNYRSVETILDAAHQVIRRHSLNTPEVRAYSNIQGVKTLTVMETPTERSEATAVGRIIESMVGGFGFQSIDFGGADGAFGEREHAFSDFAVLYRSHVQGQILSKTLQDAGIPCQLVHRESVYGQPGVLELTSLLKLVFRKGIMNDFDRVCRLPFFGWDESSLADFKDRFYAAETPLDALLWVDSTAVNEMPGNIQERFFRTRDVLKDLRESVRGKSLGAALSVLKDRAGLQRMIDASPERAAALEGLIQRTDSRSCERVDDLFAAAALETDADLHDGEAQKVTLMTFHASKGLEFPVVFIVGCEDGLVPFRRADNHCEDPAEERRLFYVGMTRARERLFLLSAGNRMVHGRLEKRILSPFVLDIERRLVERRRVENRGSAKQPIQLGLFTGE